MTPKRSGSDEPAGDTADAAADPIVGVVAPDPDGMVTVRVLVNMGNARAGDTVLVVPTDELDAQIAAGLVERV